MSLDAGADHLALVGDEHEFVRFAHGEGAGDAAGLLVGLHRDDAFAAARLRCGISVERRALADAVLAGDEQHGVLDRRAPRRRRSRPCSGRMPQTPTVSRPWSRSLFLVEADAHALVGDEHDLVRCRWSACSR